MGKTKKTNVMTEVSESVYTNVVEPFKSRKAFGKLAAHLLTAYYENESINAYINASMDGRERELNEDLLRDLRDAQDKLAMMGMLGNQAEAVVNNGQKDFEDILDGNSEGEDIRGNYNNPSALTREDVVDIVRESLSGIEDMLKQIMSNGIVTKTDYPNNVTNVEVTEKSKPEPEPVVETVSVVELEEEPEVVEVKESVLPSKEQQAKAKDALGSLMSSLGF